MPVLLRRRMQAEPHRKSMEGEPGLAMAKHEDAGSGIAHRYQNVEKRVAAACQRAGRDVSDVRIVAVSKTVGLDEVEEAIGAGIHDFGENRARPFSQKVETFPGERWHFIGKLQTNKVRDVVGRAMLIHSVDSVHLLEAISRYADKRGNDQRLLIEVNVSGEESKSGFAPAEVAEALDAASKLPHVKVLGLMTMAPQGDLEVARQTFAGLRELRDELAPKYSGNVELKELSMGMSEDFEVGIEEGATIIRVGRTIFDPFFSRK